MTYFIAHIVAVLLKDNFKIIRYERFKITFEMVFRTFIIWIWIIILC